MVNGQFSGTNLVSESLPSQHFSRGTFSNVLNTCGGMGRVWWSMLLHGLPSWTEAAGALTALPPTPPRLCCLVHNQSF